MEDKKSRLKKFQSDFSASDYTSKLEKNTKRIQELQEQKDTLNREFRGLSLQADSRAKLDLKRREVTTKSKDVKDMCV